MPFAIQPLRKEDVPRCVDIYYAAFTNVHSRACWPRVPSIRAWWEKMIVDELEEPGAHWLKAVDLSNGLGNDDDTNGTIVAYAKWVEPKPGSLPSVELPEWPEGADTALCNGTFGDWARKHRELMGDRGHWFLEMVGTDPVYQGRGAGSQILRWGLDKADAQGLEAYLDSSPEAREFYEKYGFREAARTDFYIENERVEGEWYRETFMIRPAKGAS